MFDLVIEGGRVVTGTGNPWFRADVAVKGGRIAEIGWVSGGAEETLDASGKFVCPGFIDLHDHSDFSLMVNREAENKVHMGVSTLVFPSCGGGAAPMNDEMREDTLRRSPFLGSTSGGCRRAASPSTSPPRSGSARSAGT